MLGATKGLTERRGWKEAVIVALLIAQNVSAILSIHRLRHDSETPCCASVTVAMIEIVKFFCWIASAWYSAGSVGTVIAFLWDAVATRNGRTELFRMAFPAALYVMQTNLLYYALGHLDPVTFQLTTQLKILTSAGFMVLLLGKRLTGLQWLALMLLALGVGCVEVAGSSVSSSSSFGTLQIDWRSHYLLGFLAVAAASVTSGSAGVYLEKVFKGKQLQQPRARDLEFGDSEAKEPLLSEKWHEDEKFCASGRMPSPPPSPLLSPVHSKPEISTLAAANLRLCIIGIPIAIVNSLSDSCGSGPRGWSAISSWGWLPWFVVLNGAAGGVLVALTIKYLDNIVKSFATAGSILLAGLLGPGGLARGPMWWSGAGSVLVSIWMYQISP